MALTRVDTGLQSFPDFNRNQQLANAQIYIGVPGLDPAILANQYQAYVVQENGTQVAVPQPIRTSAGGIPTYLGSPVQIAVAETAYSVKVLNSLGSQIYYQPDNTDLAQINAAQVSYTAQGAGAIDSTVEQKLYESVSVLDFGTDQAALSAACTASKSVLIPPNTSIEITSEFTIPNGVTIKGADRVSSEIFVSGDTNGLKINRFTTLQNLRIRGTAAMTSARQLIGLGTTGDSARSNIIDCIIGGSSTELGDASNIRCGGAGIRGNVTFLNNIQNCYLFQCDIGFINAGSVTNAIKFSGTEFHRCRLGADLLNPQGIEFAQCTFENNDEHGMIVKSSRSLVLNACYFEANHNTTAATIKADLLVDNSDPGASITMNGLFFLFGGNTQYGLYVDRQRGVSLNGAYFNGYASAINYLFAGSTSSLGFGQFKNVFANGAASRSINGTRWGLEGFESSGVQESATLTQSNFKFRGSINAPLGGNIIDMFYSPGLFGGNNLAMATVTPPSGARWAEVVVLGTNYSVDSGDTHTGYNISNWDLGGNKIRTLFDVNNSVGANSGFVVLWTGTAIQVTNKGGMGANQRGKVFMYFYS